METQLNPTSNHGTQQWEELIIVGWFLVPSGMAVMVSAH